MRIGYIRVSTVEQNTERQLADIELDKVFEDRVSGKSKAGRSGLKNMIDFARDGDTVFVHSMDRIARNLDDLREIVHDLNDKGVIVQFVKEGLSFTGDDTAMSRLLLSVMGAVAEFQRALMLEVQREGIAIAKSKGLYRGKPRMLTVEMADEMIRRHQDGEKVSDLAREFEVSRATFYNYLKYRVE